LNSGSIKRFKITVKHYKQSSLIISVPFSPTSSLPSPSSSLPSLT
jgi:hypothetical protein